MVQGIRTLFRCVVGMFRQLIHAHSRGIAPGWEKRSRAGRLRRRSGDHSKWGYRICIAMVLLLSAATSRVYGAGRTVRVGVYQNKPKIFMDENGHASGFFIDYLTEIAAEEGWTLVYVPCEWAECLVALEARTDRPDAGCRLFAQSAIKSTISTSTPVAESWSQVYANPRLQVNGFNDLNGRRVAVLRGSIQQTVFEQYMRGFGYRCHDRADRIARGGVQSGGQRLGGCSHRQPFLWRLFLPGRTDWSKHRSFSTQRRCSTRQPRGAIPIFSKPSTGIWARGFKSPIPFITPR